jgi:tetratricopeptide (TPR) repeat protein
LVKKLVKTERRQSEKPLPPTSIDAIPIRIVDSSPYVHYPASQDDLRELLRMLPASLTDGLKAVELCLGKQSHLSEQSPLWAEFIRDPYTSRLGYETLSGVYTGRSLGSYYQNRGIIRLFAYVYAPELPHRNIVEFYLRLRMLMVFTHELGHHFDFMSRVSRGRWRADTYDKDEIYAEKTEHDWAQQYVIKYLEQKYKKETAELRTWMLKHAGVTVPLTFLAGDPRGTGPGGTIRTNALFDVADAFKDFVSSVIQNQDPTKACIEFARNIHYSNEYELPLTILRTVLDKDPANIEAIILESDIFIHQEKFELARQRAEAALGMEPENVDALELLADAFEGLKQWKELETVADKLIGHYKDKKGKAFYWSSLIQRARARIGLGDYAGGRVNLDEAAKGNPSSKRKKRPVLPKGRLEPIIEDINKQLQQKMSETQRKLAEQLRDDMNKQIRQAGKDWHITWPVGSD